MNEWESRYIIFHQLYHLPFETGKQSEMCESEDVSVYVNMCVCVCVCVCV